VAIWVLAVAQVFSPKVVVAEVAAVVGSDVAVAVDGSGCQRRGWEVYCGAVGLLGSVCHCLQDAGDSFKAGDDGAPV
jgi:hypothetical protein